MAAKKQPRPAMPQSQVQQGEGTITLPVAPPLASPIYTLEQFYGALVYWNLFGLGRGKIWKDDREESAFKLKLPGLHEVVYYARREVTGDFVSDKIPNRGPAGLSTAEIDLMSGELEQIMTLPVPKVTKPAATVIKATSYVSITWRVSYIIYDGRLFASLDPKFQRDVIGFIESVFTGRLNEVIPVFFYEDLSFLDGAWVMSGKDHHILGIQNEDDLARLNEVGVYDKPGGPQRWAWLRALKYSTSPGRPRFALRLEDAEAEELRKEVPDCPLLQLRDRGIEIRLIKRQTPKTSEAIQKLLDEQSEVELKRRIARVTQGQEIDEARKDIIVRRYHALASAENLVTELAGTTTMLKERLNLDQNPPIELVFEMAYGYNFLRTMRLTPEGKFFLTDVRGTLEMAARRLGAPNPTDTDGFVDAVLRRFGIQPQRPAPPDSTGEGGGPASEPEPPVSK